MWARHASHHLGGWRPSILPYTYHLTVALYLTLCLYADAHATSLLQQDVLGVLTFGFLFVSTRFSQPAERRQVWLLVGIATCVELFCSLLWGLYRYRFGNVPLYVPPGHGLIYLFALRWARTPVMAAYGSLAKSLAIMGAILFAVGGLTLEPLLVGRLDVMGAFLLPPFLYFMRTRAAPIFVGCFLATSVLEIVGTSFGNWQWMVMAPVVHLPIGNPPSVIAGGYCLLDFMTLQLARRLPPESALRGATSRVSLGRKSVPRQANAFRPLPLRAPRTPASLAQTGVATPTSR